MGFGEDVSINVSNISPTLKKEYEVIFQACHVGLFEGVKRASCEWRCFVV